MQSLEKALNSSHHRVAFTRRRRLTYLGEALAQKLQQIDEPLISDYRIFRELIELYRNGSVKYLRESWPTRNKFLDVKHMLIEEEVIKKDKDYGSFWRLLHNEDRSADEVACVADPFCYISHLSAMQRYGLTDRRPDALTLTQRDKQTIRRIIASEVEHDLGDLPNETNPFVCRRYITNHPASARGRHLRVLSTTRFGEWRKVRGSFARIASIGQVFLDMIDSPKNCGGMHHVLDIWEEHSPMYLEEIIERIDRSVQPIQKIRAGYILDERLGIKDIRIEKWRDLAERGGSRILDPSEPFSDRHSESWMISINV